MVTLAMEKPMFLTNVPIEPSEGQYLRYFSYLRDIYGSHRLWSTYNLLSKSHKKKYGLGLNQWPKIYQTLEQYEHEEYQRLQGANNNNMAHFYNVH